MFCSKIKSTENIFGLTVKSFTKIWKTVYGKIFRKPFSKTYSTLPFCSLSHIAHRDNPPIPLTGLSCIAPPIPAAAPRLSHTVSPRRPSRVSFAPSTPSVGLKLGSVLQTPLSHRLPPRWDSSSDLLGSALQAPTVVRSKIREIFMPALSSTMTEGKIVSWIKSEGGSVVVIVGSQLHHDRGSLPLNLFLGTIRFLNFF